MQPGRHRQWSGVRLKCTKVDFRRDSALDPTGETYSAPPDPLHVLKGLRLKEEMGKGM